MKVMRMSRPELPCGTAVQSFRLQILVSKLPCFSHTAVCNFNTGSCVSFSYQTDRKFGNIWAPTTVHPSQEDLGR
jgi:hypothetical protein